MTRKGTRSREFEELAVGGTLTYQIIDLPNIRSFASSCGLRWGRTYKTETDREKGTITVTVNSNAKFHQENN